MELRIKECRKAAGLTLAELAQRAGLSVSYMSELENNLKPINSRRLQAIARALKVREFELIDFGDVSPDLRSLLRIAASLSPEALGQLLAAAEAKAPNAGYSPEP